MLTVSHGARSLAFPRFVVKLLVVPTERLLRGCVNDGHGNRSCDCEVVEDAA